MARCWAPGAADSVVVRGSRGAAENHQEFRQGKTSGREFYHLFTYLRFGHRCLFNDVRFGLTHPPKTPKMFFFFQKIKINYATLY